jgi:hypothetical protein
VKSKTLQNCPETFAEVLEELYAFLRPLGHVIGTDDNLAGHWPPGGPWEFGKQADRTTQADAAPDYAHPG